MTLLAAAPRAAATGTVRSGLPERAARLLVAGTVAVPAVLSAVPLDRWALRLLPLPVLVVLLLTPLRTQLRLRVPWALLLLLAWATVSVVWSADTTSTLRRLFELYALCGAAVLAGQLLGLRGARAGVALGVQLVLGAVTLSLLVVPGWATAPGSDGAPGWHGVLSHKNSLGFFCVVALVTLWLHLPPGRRRWAWTVLGVVLLIGSQSSSALAVAVVALGVLVWTRARAGLLLPASRAAASTLLALALAGLLLVAVRTPDLVFGLLGRSSSLTGRTEIWAATWRQVLASPWLGHGWGGLWQPSSAPTLALWREARFQAYYAHNGYLDVLAQLGVVGLGLLLVVLLGTLRHVWQRRSDDVHLWAALVIVVLLVWSVTESAPFTGEGLFLVLLLASALGGSLRRAAGTAPSGGPPTAGRAAAPPTSG